jgi:chromosomal replication initiator protein
VTVSADAGVNKLSVDAQKGGLPQNDSFAQANFAQANFAQANGLAQELSTHLPEIWSAIRLQLRAEYGARTFESWLKPLELGGLEDGVIVHHLPNGFMRDWIKNHFAQRLISLWQAQLPFLHDVRFDVISTRPVLAPARNAPTQNAPTQEEAAAAAKASALEIEHEPTSAQNPASSAATAKSPTDLVDHSGALLDPRFTFDRFVVGASNRFAFTAAQRIAEGGAVTFNPLFLHSSVGLGKTHLMHAIAWEIRNRHPERKVLYMSAEKFMVEFVSALRHQDTVAFKQRFRNVDVLMIDDVQFIAGKNSTQDEFFHTFNALIDYRRQLIISADRSPSDLEGIEERIRSRLGWGLVADIHPTDYELRLGILHSKLEKAPDMPVPMEVLEFLARRINSNVRELEGALNRVVAHGTLVGRPVTLEFTKSVLQDLLRANDRKITIDEIQRKVAEYYKVRMADLLSARRSREVARPRQIAMYLAKRYTPRSLPEIGRKFGGRDHTTVIHAVKRIEELRTTDSELDGDLNSLSRLLDA